MIFKKKTFCTDVFILTIILFSSVMPCFAKAKPLDIKIGFYQNPPKIFLNSNGKISGFWPDLIAGIAEEENWKIKYIKGTWYQCLDRLKKGEINIMPDVAFTEKRSRLFIFSRDSVLTSWSKVYVNKTNNGILSIVDLKNKKIAALKGSVSLEGADGMRDIARKFDLNCTFLEFGNYENVFKAVQEKIADAGITTREFGNKNAEKYKIKSTGIIFQPITIKFAFPENSSVTPLLVKKIDLSIKKLKSDNNSLYFQLIKKYLEAEIIEKSVKAFPGWAKIMLLITGFLLLCFFTAFVIAKSVIKKQTQELEIKNQELSQSRDDYRQLLDESPLSIILFDNNGIVTFINKWQLKTFAKNRYGHDFFVGKKITELTGIASAGLGHELEKVLHGETILLENIFVPVFSGNQEGFLNLKAVPVYGKGQFKGGILIGEDVTQQNLAAKKMEEQRLFFKAIIDAMPCFICVKDDKARTIFVNKMAKNIFGAAEKDILNKTSLEFMKDQKTAQKIYQEDMELLSHEKKKIEREGRYRDVKGKIHQTYIEKFPMIKDADSNIKQIITVLTDITRIKELEAQVVHAQKMESIGILAGGVAHDFNNILTIINGRSDMALMGMDTTDPLYKDINEIRRAGKRAETLTRQLLAFSRKQIYQPEIVDLNALIAGMDKMLRRLIGEDIDMELFLDKGALTIKADPGQIEQIFMNLVVNARDSIIEKTDTASEMKITIETGQARLDDEYIINHPGAKKGRHVYFSVSDTGTGMDKDTRDNIFTPFFTTKPQGKGTGLGLSTVYGIVKQNKGSVYVYSEPGKGSTFKIYWPFSRAEKEESKIRQYQTEDFIKGNEIILLVEDNENLRIFTKEALKKMGYIVYEASNGKKAMKLMEYIVMKDQIKIDLLITDIIMPEMGGRELAEKLNAEFPDLKVLFTSGYTDNHIVKNGELERGVNFIQKPFTVHGLSRKLREILDS